MDPLGSTIKARVESLVNTGFDGNWRQLALKAGVQPSTLQRIKDNEAIPGGDTLLKIAKAGNVAVDWLLGGENGSCRVAEAPAPYGSVRAVKLNPEDLAGVFMAVEEELDKKGGVIDAAKKAAATALIYEIALIEKDKTILRERIAQVIGLLI